MISTGKAREQIAGQIKDAADKIGAGVLAALAVAGVAILIAAAALMVAVKAVRAIPKVT